MVRDDYGGGGGRDVVPGEQGGQEGRLAAAEERKAGRKKAVAFTAEEQLMETIEEERAKPNVMPLLEMKLLIHHPIVAPLIARFVVS